VACGRAWAPLFDVFDTNSIDINPSAKSVFEKLVAVSKRCPSYSYVIETHADKRADSRYNEMLAKARGHAIKDFLQSQGMEYHRLRSVSFGDSKPLVDGNSSAAHAVNRRVVVIPTPTPALTQLSLE
ncbi:MAG: OmpA family protein, partial [Gammaproteobacteria bacterium]|nr:OmpA family protein [Gammaproteobacteria bacterium]